MFRWTIGELLNIFEEVRDFVYELDRNLLIPIGVDVSDSDSDYKQNSELNFDSMLFLNSRSWLCKCEE